MAFKKFELSNGLLLTVYKRRTSRNLRLSIAPDGEIKVSIPLWTPYSAALAFANSRMSWIEEQQQPIEHLFEGQRIGKAHTLHFKVKIGLSEPVSRIKSNSVTVTHGLQTPVDDIGVQKVAEAAAIRALRLEAEALLPQRLKTLAQQHSLSYRSVTVKRLKSRWGSCDQHHDIALNLFLMQLPWELIDYVLLHELAHTVELNHSPEFWQTLEGLCPNYKLLKKTIHKQKPVVNRLSTLY